MLDSYLLAPTGDYYLYLHDIANLTSVTADGGLSSDFAQAITWGETGWKAISSAPPDRGRLLNGIAPITVPFDASVTKHSS